MNHYNDKRQEIRKRVIAILNHTTLADHARLDLIEAAYEEYIQIIWHFARLDEATVYQQNTSARSDVKSIREYQTARIDALYKELDKVTGGYSL